MVNKNSKADRAKQFAPFAALTGYYDIINERDKIFEPRRERSDEENERLSEKMNSVRKGSMVKLTFYHEGCYQSINGMVSNLDLVDRTITIVKRKFKLDDVYDVELLTYETF